VALRNDGKYVGLPTSMPLEEAIFGSMVKSEEHRLMELLNLSLGQFLMLFGAVSGFSVALYLLDRTRRKQVVSTLRFWVAPGQPAPVSRRRKIQQPLSLLLQLLGMALLLLAIAEFQFGGRRNAPRSRPGARYLGLDGGSPSPGATAQHAT
jgi:hypothetical protein